MRQKLCRHACLVLSCASSSCRAVSCPSGARAAGEAGVVPGHPRRQHSQTHARLQAWAHQVELLHQPACGILLNMPMETSTVHISIAACLEVMV